MVQKNYSFCAHRLKVYWLPGCIAGFIWINNLSVSLGVDLFVGIALNAY